MFSKSFSYVMRCCVKVSCGNCPTNLYKKITPLKSHTLLLQLRGKRISCTVKSSQMTKIYYNTIINLLSTKSTITLDHSSPIFCSRKWKFQLNGPVSMIPRGWRQHLTRCQNKNWKGLSKCSLFKYFL